MSQIKIDKYKGVIKGNLSKVIREHPKLLIEIFDEEPDLREIVGLGQAILEGRKTSRVPREEVEEVLREIDKILNDDLESSE